MSPDGPIGVLCVESNQGMCEALQRLLAPPRFVWLGAVGSLTEADDALQRLRPTLLLIAATGNEGGAIEWARGVKASRPDLRVALLTADGNPDLLAEALWAGLDGVLSKLDDPATIAPLLARAAAGQPAVGPEVQRLLAARGPAA
mgnify:CR=1 FL=1|jgi:DNA-binding NarL/FixJ family response regulator